MSTRGRQWLYITGAFAVSLGIPTLIVWAGWSYRSPKVDIAFPASCDALFTRVAVGPLDQSLQDARTLATSKNSTDEERACATNVVRALGSPTSESGVDDCSLGEMLENGSASPAAAAIYQYLASDPHRADQTCGSAGLERVGTSVLAGAPDCTAVGRLLAVGNPTDASTFSTESLSSSSTAEADAACIERSIAVLRGLAGSGLPDATTIRTSDIPGPCKEAVNAAKAGKIEQARKDLRKVLQTAAPGDVQGCAEGALSRLPAQLTLTDWTFQGSNRLLDDATNWVPGGPLAISDGTKPIVAGGIWLVSTALLLIGVRQWTRWRRERLPGPVKVGDVTGASNKPDEPVLSNLLRRRLAETGIYPNPTVSGVGELAVDVDAVLDATSAATWFAPIAKALKSVFSLTTGYKLTASIDHNGDEGQVQIQVQLDQASTGQTVAIECYGGASERDAVESAA